METKKHCLGLFIRVRKRYIRAESCATFVAYLYCDVAVIMFTEQLLHTSHSLAIPLRKDSFFCLLSLCNDVYCELQFLLVTIMGFLGSTWRKYGKI